MITTDDDQIAQKYSQGNRRGGYGSRKKWRKKPLTGLAMFVATHPALYWATVHPAVVVGNMLGKDPIHERSEKQSELYDEVPDTTKSKESTRRCTGCRWHETALSYRRAQWCTPKNGKALDEALVGITGLTVPSYPAGAEPISHELCGTSPGSKCAG